MSLSTSIELKLEGLSNRHEEVSLLLSDPDVVSHRERYTALMKEFAELEPVVAIYSDFKETSSELTETESLLNDKDVEIRGLAQTDITELKAKIEEVEGNLKKMLIPKDPNDQLNVFLEIRAGTGGDEAAMFAGALFRMYGRYAEKHHWHVETLSERHGEHGGFKEVIARIEGKDVFSRLKFESGAHRVQRVPETESQGRVHTSACTVAVLPEQADIKQVDIDAKEIRVDTYRSSGAGGQHVNKTDSAVRVTHLPTGIVVECQDERSQHKNRARAMSLLSAKLLDNAQSEQRAEQAATRRTLVGSGDRSERIRTYNFPERRVTDHRISLVLYRLDEVLGGDLDELIGPLTQEHQADLLARLGDNP